MSLGTLYAIHLGNESGLFSSSRGLNGTVYATYTMQND